jgi:hypothetical protein
MSAEAESAQERGLRRELRFWEAIALSIGIMAPGAAMVVAYGDVRVAIRALLGMEG